ncbi:diaminopimelate epimerase [Nocardiopsis algeriensis]|uniref:Diaminopimelate epimerase n=1 Tax=Nocardiopsis algeriensis TaxID=1478215 RepID=A0A841IUP7_9ACTN|nr:diaminopimelate epimerase [Nocardiopsis algeriensis]MBB6121970.1 diaminopimelate epimerase [Nocardiopsis algeriensis]
MRFAKGHGTENDFVILPDPDGELDLTEETVRLLCDRRAGIGGDGVLRVVRTRALGEGLAPSARTAERAEWFMDYRNSDGSVAEMCGNGVRVFARYLLHAGYVEGDRFEVGTRDGAKQVTVETDGDITVGMGLVEMQGSSSAELARQVVHGTQISVGNPHLACEVPGPVSEVDLSVPPVLDTEAFPDGANVEIYNEVAPGVLEMRVHERGSGETRSCGTGIVAAAAAATPPGENAVWRVRVPGGECTVTLDADGVRLSGPAVVVAEGETSLV